MPLNELPDETAAAEHQPGHTPAIDTAGTRQGAERVLQLRHVQPLSDELYNRVFNGQFVPNSTEYSDPETQLPGPMLIETKRIFSQLKVGRFASVGTGTGFFDGNLMADMPIQQYFAIEPNPHHVAQIPGNIANVSGTKTIVPTHFDAGFDHPDLPKNLDSMLFTHCVYFMKNPAAAVQHALEYLDDTGALVILHQSERGVCTFFRHFEAKFGLQWAAEAIRQDHAMSTQTISVQLAQAGIGHQIGEKPAHLYVDEFHTQAFNRDAALDMITFFMNTDARQFTPTEQDEMIEWVRTHSVDHNGRKALEHPQGFLVVPKNGQTNRITAMEPVHTAVA